MYHRNISRSNAKFKDSVSAQIYGEPDVTVVTCFVDTTSVSPFATRDFECDMDMPYNAHLSE